MTRICLRCGRSMAINSFRRDPSRPKRLVASKCLDCETRTGRSSVMRPARAPDHRQQDVACNWCGTLFKPDRTRKRYCTQVHRLLYEAEDKRIRRWDLAALKAEGLA